MQQRRLVASLQAVVGRTRLPMLVLDSRALLDRSAAMSARAAGVLGMMTMGRDYAFALDQDQRLDPVAVDAFLDQHGDRPFLIFGFTFMVWTFLAELGRHRPLDLSNGRLVHSGGWKKLADQAVGPAEFRERLTALTGLRRIHSFYGMVEQIGTAFLEGPSGHLYCPDFADVLIRDPETLQPAPIGRPGLVQVISTLPESYPGHVLMTEDLGVLHGIDDGDWPGKRFSVLGRLPRAERRGCADTFTEAAAG
jgi:hypothetical protein